MTAWSRRRVAARVVATMRRQRAMPKTLAVWLAELNAALPARHRFRSTRQLAMFFRYVNSTVLSATSRYAIQRHVYTSTHDDTPSTLTSYALVPAQMPVAPPAHPRRAL